MVLRELAEEIEDDLLQADSIDKKNCHTFWRRIRKLIESVISLLGSLAGDPPDIEHLSRAHWVGASTRMSQPGELCLSEMMLPSGHVLWLPSK
jgi:hypothetical protein